MGWLFKRVLNLFLELSFQLFWSQVVWIEREREAVWRLKANVALIKCPRLNVISQRGRERNQERRATSEWAAPPLVPPCDVCNLDGVKDLALNYDRSRSYLQETKD